jgi:hypothetical protein
LNLKCKLYHILLLRGICQHDEEIYPFIADLVPHLAKGYLHVFVKACESEALFGKSSDDHLKAREFFGLRDFYRLFLISIC